MTTLQTQVLGADCAQEIVLRMTPENLPQLEITSEGVKHYKAVTLTELLNLLDQSIVVKQLEQEQRHRVTLPALPERTLFVTTDETPDNLCLDVTGWVPSTMYPFLYENTAYMVYIPTMVYQVTWSANSKRAFRMKLAVTTDESASADSPLFRWPYSNVYDSSGVCWSGLYHVTCELHEVIEKALFAFIQTPNNRDLFGVGLSQNSSHRDYGAFLQAAQDTGSIPVEWFIPHNQTVREFHAR